VFSLGVLTWAKNAISFLKVFFGHFYTHGKGINMQVVIDGKCIEVLSSDRNIEYRHIPGRSEAVAENSPSGIQGI
jgi:hypothetical protein